MKTPSETIVVPAVDGKEEPEPTLAVPSGNKVSGKKTPKTVTKKLAPKKARKAVKKAARKKATKVAITKATKRRPFPYERVLRMWKAGKTLETIARAVGRYQPKADDPLRSFRIGLTRFHKGVRINGKLVKLPYRVSKSSVKLAIKAGKRAAQ
jgi:hypothetical protein